MKRRLLLTATAALLAGAAVFAASPKRELRSIWLTTYVNIDWPSSGSIGNAEKSKADLIAYLDKHQDRNYTGVCLHVRCMADAVYNSSYEPFSQYVSGTRGKDPGWDPLAFAVEECHKRGLECYAWVNPYRFNRNNQARTTTQDKWVLSQPGWIIDNGTTTSHNEYQVFNPALPEVREYLLKIMKEIYTNYRIDGMLFDDYFYPNGIPANSTAQDYADFVEQTGITNGTSQQIGDWRRENINLFIRQLYEMIQNDRPDMRFGLSPAGIGYKGCKDVDGLEPPGFGSDWQYDDIYSDPVAWLNDGSIDFISPQLYWFSRSGSNSYTTAAPYDGLAQWWSNTADFFGRHFYSSMGPYRLADNNGSPVYNNEKHWEDLSNQINLNRQYSRNNAPGAIMYSAKYMDGPLCSGWGEYLEEHSFQNKSLVPVVDWKEHAPLAKPENLTFEDGRKLRWTVANANPAPYDPIIRYSVYAIPAHIKLDKAMTDDGISGAYLLDVVYGGEYEIPTRKREGYWYAVCTYDGYGFESEPATANEDVPVVAVTRDETEYESYGQLNIRNLWYRSTGEGFENIEFDPANGNLNRGIVIDSERDRVLVSGRRENSNGPGYLLSYSLSTGHFLEEIEIAFDDVTYPCNDIFRDNKGNFYIVNLSTGITSSKPVIVHRFDPATNTVTEWAKLSGGAAARKRIDFINIEALDNGDFYAYAALSSGSTIVRWTLGSDGAIKETVSKEVDSLYPSSVSNFGPAPRIYSLGNNRVLVDGTSTALAEYDFSGENATLVAGIGSDVYPTGFSSNGMTHFGPGECYLAYAGADHQTSNGIKFNITTADTHDLASHKLMWQVPGINIGNEWSTHASTPVDAVTEGTPDAWTSHIAMLAPGNGIAVYKVTGASAGINTSVETDECRIIGGKAYFSEATEAAFYDLSGRSVHSISNGTSISLPATPGLYILKYGAKARRVIVR
mgnify:CR=1 FL=1